MPGPLTIIRGVGRARAEANLGGPLQDIVDFLLATPLVLFPLLIVAAMIVFALLKKLLKLAAILAIAGVLYALMLEYLGPGL
jgi:hypothetical protein